MSQAHLLFEKFHHLAAGEGEDTVPPELADELDRLQVLAGVRQYPVRVKCATLPWHTMEAALAGKRDVSTE